MTTNCKTAGFFFPGKATTASRPRVARGGWAYYEKPYKDWLKCAAVSLKGRTEHFAGPVSVCIIVNAMRPKKPVNPYPRGDLDNYAKGPLDALTKAGVWVDDNQVVELRVTKTYTTDPALEGIGVAITERDV